MSRVKLTANICYIAGLVSRNAGKEKSEVGINTSISEIEQKFVEIAVKDLGIAPTKIIIEELGGHRHVYFYHSRVSRLLKDIHLREVHLFKKRDRLSASYVAGMFDSAGHNSGSTLTISPLSATDTLTLENLGIHTRGNSISSITNLVSLIKRDSVLMDRNYIRV